jgi:cell division protein FtsQ
MESVLAARLRRPRASQLWGPRLRVRLNRRTLLIALAGAVALAGTFIAFRSSPLVAVDQVRITGVRGAQAAAVSEALETAAKRMSTLDYSASELEAAVARYPVVRSLRVSTSFPHRMRIFVSEQLPVAQITAGGLHSAVAADGVVLGSSLVSRSLPSLPASFVPGLGRHVSQGHLRAYLAVLGAAPAPLLGLVSKVFFGQQGLTVKMANGLLVYFGDDERPHAKWDSLVTVLTASGSAGASYVDVRLPERPAAGVPSGGVGSGESGQVSASDPTSAALAASLARAVNGESSSTPIAPAATTTEAQSSLPSGETGSEEAAASQAGQASESEGTAGAAEGG